jgi:hypothetical protein
MEPYADFRYYYPPRPEFRITAEKLPEYENAYLAQPKLNGASCLIFLKGKEFRKFGRHQNENISNCMLNLSDIEFLNCGNSNWNVVVGEYMNKNKKGIDGKLWNHKYVIFDILVHDGQYLTGTTFQERVELMHKLYGTHSEDDYLYKINETVYRVKSYYNNFLNRWDDIIQTDMLEGLVMKRKNARLEKGIAENNMKLHMLKCRKPTKLYNF